MLMIGYFPQKLDVKLDQLAAGEFAAIAFFEDVILIARVKIPSWPTSSARNTSLPPCSPRLWWLAESPRWRFGALEFRRKAALIADGSAETLLFQDRFE